MGQDPISSWKMHIKLCNDKEMGKAKNMGSGKQEKELGNEIWEQDAVAKAEKRADTDPGYDEREGRGVAPVEFASESPFIGCGGHPQKTLTF